VSARCDPPGVDVVVLCGGRGSRLGPLTARVPKPLLPVGEHPFLLHQLMRLQREGFRRFLLAAGYLPEQFEAFARTWRDVAPGMEVVIEPEPLGTGGGLRLAAERVRSERFVALNGDSVIDELVAPVLAAHCEASRAMTLVGVRAARIAGDAAHKAICRLGAEDALLGFETVERAAEGWINGGVYIIERAMALSWPAGAYSMESEMMRLVAGRRVGVWRSQGQLLDIGTPDCYAQAAEILGRSALEHSEPTAARSRA